MISNRLLIIGLLFVTGNASTQNLPAEMYFSEDGRILHTGGNLPTGLYDPNIIRDVYLDFPQPDYWSLLAANYEDEIEIPATLTMDGVVYDSVGVRFRGNTSYTMIGNSDKKSFAVASDLIHDDQKILGYNNLKFNNAHQDASFMREVLYGRMAAKHTPIAKTNYVHLYINNADWGIYPNIQGIDKTFLEEYFLSNDGARFRATNEENGFGGGWGDGTAGMNYLGTDTAEYQLYYDLKSSDIADPWQKLIDATQVLSTANVSNMQDILAKIDVDRALWFLAVENIFTDDDSYTMKGKMDYYVYYEPETDRTMPLEYDGNSTFLTNAATSASWGPFKNVSNENYPLLNKFLNIPEWRQRYLAHYRTILEETFTTENANALIDTLDAQIRDLVNADPKKLYTFQQYTNSIPVLKTFVANRRNYLLSNTAVTQVAPVISSAPFYNSALVEYQSPVEDEIVHVRASVNSAAGIHDVRLYYAEGLVGVFNVVQMYDDGGHDDEMAADGVYGAAIPGYQSGALVRYYIEAIADNTALAATYLPSGAEHDVFVYTVEENSFFNGVVINEFVASNSTGATDDAGDHEDWIELYNNNNAVDIDLSGFYLSDNVSEPDKWQFPEETVIPANSYLIVWADEEEAEGLLHAAFKLSAGGETLVFSDSSLNTVDLVTFEQQTADLGYARVPNGTGDFLIQQATFNASNNIQQVTTGVVINEILASNDSGETDEAGDHEDWIELYNNNSFDVDISGFYLTDDSTTITKWQFPAGTVISAQSYLIVWADDEADEGGLHATWNVSEGGESITFSDPLENILDRVVFGEQITDLGYARVPNGTGNFLIQQATFNASNHIQPVTTGVVVNEILASNNSGEVDEAGDFEDWVELYNNNVFDVDLGGFYLADDSASLSKWQFPAGTIIAARSYLIVWADDEADEGVLHASWKISAGGESITLSDTLLNILDQVGFGEQTTDLAFARVPNGTGDFQTQGATFNASNNIQIVTTGVVVNEILASNDSGAMDEAGDLEDWVELYNNNAFDVDLSGFSLTDDSTSLAKWQFPVGTVIGAQSYLIVWADEEADEGALHASWKISAGGESITLSDTLLSILDQVGFAKQTTDLAYARVPNGTGPFVIKVPTFNENNETSSINDDQDDNTILVYPNPVESELLINTSAYNGNMEYVIFNQFSRVISSGILDDAITSVALQHFPSGMYYLRVGTEPSQFVKIVKM